MPRLPREWPEGQTVGMIEGTPPPLLTSNGQPLHEAARYADSDEFGVGTGLALPHVFSFAAIVGGASKTYWHERFDEAMRHSRENALAMRRDAYLMSLLQERKLAVAGLPWYLEVPDPRDERQAKVRAALTQACRGVRGFRRMVLAWLEAVWYGRYAVQFAFRWEKSDERRALGVQAWSPVNGDKIGYHWDGTPWVLVNGPRASTLSGANLVRTTRGPAISLTGGWRERFVIHQHEVDDADYFDAEAHGGRYGVGIRSRIYWLDFLKREYLDWVVTYLERVGLGTRLWKYDAGNPKSKEAAEKAARDNSRRVNILVPVWGDGRGNYSGGVEVVEASTGGVEVLRSMIDALDQYVERYVVGQAGSSRGQASGIGNEASSEFMASTKDAIRDNDANLLAETITGSAEAPGLLSLMQRYTFPETVPGVPGGFPVLFKFGLEKTLNNQRVQSIQTVVGMGLPVRKDDVYNAAGLSRPEDQDDVVEGQQQQGQGQGQGGNPLAALLGGDDSSADADGAGDAAGDEPLASEADVDDFLGDLFGDADDSDDGDGEPERESQRQMARRNRGGRAAQVQYVSDFEESKHRRDEEGRFSSGGGGGNSAATAKKKDQSRKQRKAANARQQSADARRKKTGAITRSGSLSGQSPLPVDMADVVGEPATPDALRAMAADPHKLNKERTSVLGRLAAAGKSAYNAAAWVGQSAYNRLPVAGRRAVDASIAFVVWLDHTLDMVKRGTQQLAATVAEERGLPAEHVERVAKVTTAIDAVMAWTANIPLASEHLHHEYRMEGPAAFALAKLGYFLPTASLAYCAYSAVRNPLATVRAAWRVIRGKGHKGKTTSHHGRRTGSMPVLCARKGERLMGKSDLLNLVLDRMARHGESGEWWYALFCSAFDQVRDLRQAVAIADEAIERHPREPDAEDPEDDGLVDWIADYQSPHAR